ncbi:SDR family NAD(P)-dependent oxidoreductase [Chelativorans sp. J32]|uniref:SDR family NAD(P)-dependent oxidoreductase n=1 Tax=Chelativorans sp. J32 TaxID=935840 RepID=UPI0004881DA8|nr:SDR family oxidoreductase [Chelativorans sp. J32]
MESIQGKVAIVTGASSGIGLGIAREMAREGAVTILAARSGDKLRRIVEEIEERGGRAFAVPADVTQEEEVQHLFREVERLAGRLDVLVNNAGIADATPTEELALERWREVVDTNLTSAFLCSREAIRTMKRNGGGRIINIGSLSAKIPRPNSMAYTVTKFAIEGLTRSIALDGRDHNITASALHPGATVSALVPGVTDRLQSDCIDPADLGRVVVLMASLPPEITMLDTTILPVKVPFLGRG